MRHFIDLIEGSPPSNTYDTDDGGNAVGYWYHPRSGEYHIIAWEHANGSDAHSDHCDVAIDHPEWFGLDPEAEYDDCDTVRADVILNGWVRIGYNTHGHTMWMDAASPQALHRGYKWFAKTHRVQSLSVSVVTETTWEKGYTIKGSDLIEYEANGRLQPSWKV
jgi:hypothetical protein